MNLTEKIANVGKAVSDSKIRVLLLFLVVSATLAAGIAYLKLRPGRAQGPASASAVVSAPNISSIPGVGQPSREYVKLQEQENLELAQAAAKKGISAIPTVVRSTFLEQGVSADLSANSGATSVAGCGVEELTRARAAGVTAAELRCRGCSVAALKAAGFSAADLKAAGFSAAELREAGFSASDLRAAGFSAQELAAAGFSAQDLLAAGFSVGELRGAGVSESELGKAGVGPEDLALAGFGATKKLSSGACSVQNLKLVRGKGISAQELRKMGCSAEALRAAGFSAAELKAAGFSAAELKDAGFSAADLKAAGFSAAELKAAGFSAKDLMAAGFSAKELKDAGFTAGELRAAGFSAADLKDAGFSAAELKAAGFSAAELKDAGFTAQQLSDAGFTTGDLTRAGFAGLPGLMSAVSSNSCSVESLTTSRANGVSATELRKMGCSLEALKAAGFSAKELKDAGFSPAQLLAAGFSPDELRQAGFTLANEATAAVGIAKPTSEVLQQDVCSIDNLKKAKAKGMAVAKLRQLGCSVAALKAADFSGVELLGAGFSVDELAAAKFSAPDIKAASLRLAADANKVLGQLPYSNKLTTEQMNSMTSSELDDLMKRQQALMKRQADELFGIWSQMPTQLYVAGADASKQVAGGLAPLSGAAAAASEQELIKNSDIYKAGTVVFGVLDAEVNTDENSPVMATVIHGPLKEAKLLGTFQRVDKKVLLQFKVISIPRLVNSIGINAVAIDPNTAKTVLASNVDNHYWLRYGTAFATSFVSGLGSAMQNAGTTVVSNPNGITTSMPQLDTQQKIFVALGNVGQQFSSTAASLINTPPTVTVKAGTSVGLLLMSDLAVPKNKS